MSKLKVKYKGNQIIVNSKLDKTEEINQRELSVMQSKIIRGLMKPTVERSRKISYIAPNGITLKKYLSNNISKNDFILVFAQILEAFKFADRNSFNINNFVSDINYSFINEHTKEVYLIYQPISTSVSANDIALFLKDIAYNVNLPLSENYSEINDLINYIQSKPAPLIECLEKYILKKYPHIYTQFVTDGVQENLNYGMPDTVAFDNTDDFSVMSDTIAVDSVDENYDMPDTVAFGIVNEFDEMPETVAMNHLINCYACITRVRTGEEINIDKPYFVIGKSEQNTDYCIHDNNTVSRIHASITIENDNEVYFMDLESANHSYVEGVLALPNEKYRLYKGSRFYLSNEEFIFNIY